MVIIQVINSTRSNPVLLCNYKKIIGLALCFFLLILVGIHPVLALGSGLSGTGHNYFEFPSSDVPKTASLDKFAPNDEGIAQNKKFKNPVMEKVSVTDINSHKKGGTESSNISTIKKISEDNNITISEIGIESLTAKTFFPTSAVNSGKTTIKMTKYFSYFKLEWMALEKGDITLWPDSSTIITDYESGLTSGEFTFDLTNVETGVYDVEIGYSREFGSGGVSYYSDYLTNTFLITSASPKDTLGVFRGNKWYLDSSGNGAYGSGDKKYTFGMGGDKPVTGDWNGKGKSKIGVFRGNKWYVDYDGNGVWAIGDTRYTFGLTGDIPVTGDWNGNRKSKIGVFRGNKWYLDISGNGAWGSGDKQYTFGMAGDKPVTGDWNGNGKSKIGVFRGNKWYVDYDGNGVWAIGDKKYTFGLSGDKPVTGDWNGDGKTEIGVMRGNKFYLDYSGNGAWGAGDKTFTFGLTGDIPITGAWSGTSGTASIQSVELNPVTKPDGVFKVPAVKRPVTAVPKVEMPVQSNSVIRPMTSGGIPSNTNPIASAGPKISGNPIL